MTHKLIIEKFELLKNNEVLGVHIEHPANITPEITQALIKGGFAHCFEPIKADTLEKLPEPKPAK